MKKFRQLSEQHREKGRFKPTIPHNVKSHTVATPRMKEEVEQIDELSKEKLNKYVTKAIKQHPAHPEYNPENKKTTQRVSGLRRATSRLYKEEVDTPPIHVRSMYTRQYAKHGGTISTAKTASAKAYDAVEKMHGKEMRDKLEAFHRKNVNENVEQIDEISDKTLSSYTQKAKVSADKLESEKKFDKALKRRVGVLSAVSKMTGRAGQKIGQLAREETEQLDELSPATKASYKEKAKKTIAELRPHAKSGEYKDIAKNIISRREKGLSKMKEEVEQLDEKNKPTNPELWSRAVSMAKQKFDVYPSAYANGWAAKWYKSKGGGWRSVSEAVSSAQQAAIAISMKKAGKKPKDVKEETVEEGTWHTVKHTTGPTKIYVPSKDEENPPFEGGTKAKEKVIPGKYGKGYSTARHLARMAMQKQMKKAPIKEESRKAAIVKDALKKKKETSDDKFEVDPIMSKSVTRNY